MVWCAWLGPRTPLTVIVNVEPNGPLPVHLVPFLHPFSEESYEQIYKLTTPCAARRGELVDLLFLAEV